MDILAANPLCYALYAGILTPQTLPLNLARLVIAAFYAAKALVSIEFSPRQRLDCQRALGMRHERVLLAGTRLVLPSGSVVKAAEADRVLCAVYRHRGADRAEEIVGSSKGISGSRGLVSITTTRRDERGQA